MVTGKKSEVLAQIKAEPSDQISENFEYDFQCFDNVEIGEEFKTEPLEIKQASGENSKQNDAKYKLIFCIQCNTTRNVLANTIRKCATCKSVLKFKCGKCTKVYSSFGDLGKHLLHYCNKEPRISCDHCDFKCYFKGHLINHIKAKHLPKDSNPNKCAKCGRVYMYVYDFKKHLKLCNKKSESKFFHCDNCKYKSYFKAQLVQHMKAMHLPRDPNSNKCNKCGKCYSNRSYLLSHSKKCGLLRDPKLSELKKFSCDHCSYKNSRKSNLLKHIKAKHLPRDLVKCTRCGKTYASQSSLWGHTKYCSKLKDSKASLTRFSCDNCNYKTINKQQLVNHMQLKHSNDTFECAACGKSFGSWINLNCHQRRACKVMNKLKPLISCEYCSYKNKQKRNLRRHMLAKHSKEGFKCVECKKSFSSQYYLNYHVKNVDCKK